MFDIGFAELLIAGIVALVVIGPERLPGAIRTGSMWWGRIRRSMSSMKEEIEREVGADEIRRQLHNESVLDSLRSADEALKETQRDVNKSIQNVASKATDSETTKP